MVICNVAGCYQAATIFYLHSIKNSITLRFIHTETLQGRYSPNLVHVHPSFVWRTGGGCRDKPPFSSWLTQFYPARTLTSSPVPHSQERDQGPSYTTAPGALTASQAVLALAPACLLLTPWPALFLLEAQSWLPSLPFRTPMISRKYRDHSPHTAHEIWWSLKGCSRSLTFQLVCFTLTPKLSSVVKHQAYTRHLPEHNAPCGLPFLQVSGHHLLRSFAE